MAKRPIVAPRKKNLITIDAAMVQYDISRDTIYRLIRPRRSGRKIRKPRVRSKVFRNRRWLYTKDLRKIYSIAESALKPLS